ncbi:hypothetical protein COH20_001970 [Aspergillus flavus]|nr:hypothetical protein G4B11_010332 [Aspergillus flavus]RAQ60068.1 hypothetical protein COH20_001970 [Aspergillus flavus]RAQ81767.1 hypothetical protein COH21_012556 [Aspergillus flavus]
MATFSPIPAYALGTLTLALGCNALARPGPEYPRFGLPFESAASPASTHGNNKRTLPPGAVSPLMYIKGIREMSYGLTLLALQYYRQETAVTIFAAVCALVGLADGFVVWANGGKALRMKAFGHWITCLGFGGWAWWRACA